MSQFYLHKDDKVGIVWGNFVGQENKVTKSVLQEVGYPCQQDSTLFLFLFLFFVRTPSCIYVILNIGVFFVGLG